MDVAYPNTTRAGWTKNVVHEPRTKLSYRKTINNGEILQLHGYGYE